MQLDSKYSADLPVSYVQASVLKDSIIDYSNNPSRRRSGRLFDNRGWGEVVPCCILGRYTDVKSAATKIPEYSGLDGVLSLSDEEFPPEIRRTGASFLRDIVTFSDTNEFWKKQVPSRAIGSADSVSGLTALGKSAARSIISKHGLTGIAQTNGLQELVS